MRANLPVSFLCGLALIALGACGGGGGDDPPRMTSMEPEPEMTYDVALPVDHGLTAGTIEVPADGIELDSGTTISCANDDGCTLTVTAQPVTGQLQATSTGGQVTVMTAVELPVADDDPVDPDPEPADADALAEAERRAAEAEEARQAAEAEAAKAKEEAERAREEAAKQGNINLRAAPIRAKLAGVTATDVLTATVTYAPGRQKVFRPNRTLDRGTAPSISGWSGASFTGETGTTSEFAYLYTDIGGPAKRAFWKVYGKDETVSATDAKAKPSGFGNGRHLYQTADGTQEDQSDVSRGGTYDGASGTFTCATGCNITADAEGALTFVGAWTFTASTSGLRTGVGDSIQDAAYLYFGIWDQEPLLASDTSETNRDFEYIAGGGAGLITDLSGFDANDTATFEGGAVGRYVVNREGQGARIGTFTAKAVLNATALGGTPMIQGRISDFREGGSALGDDWTVFLGGTGNSAARFGSGSVADGAVASARIDGIVATGSWGADLYGILNPGHGDFYETGETPGTDQVKCPVSSCPAADLAGVAGWFNAFHATAAAIAGAFAAKHTGE